MSYGRARGIAAEFAGGVKKDSASTEIRKKEEALKLAYAQLFGNAVNFGSKVRNNYMMNKHGGSDPFLYRVGGEGGTDFPVNIARGTLNKPRGLLDNLRRTMFLKESDFTPTNYGNMKNIRPSYASYNPPAVDKSISYITPDDIPLEGIGGMKGASSASASIAPNLLDKVAEPTGGGGMNAAMAAPSLAMNVGSLVSPQGQTFADRNAQKQSSAINIGTTLLSLALALV